MLGLGPSVHVVLLSGGSGTRLWPLSNSARSKQFLKVLRDDKGEHESMVQRTVRLVRARLPEVSVTVATSQSQADAIGMQLERPYHLSIEPCRRDTAPAIMLAVAKVARQEGARRDATVVVMPIDTYADESYYDNIGRLDAAVQEGVADLVLLGVTPTRPSSKFGYIVPATSEGRVRTVERFEEKPARARAQELIERGALWNCGVFAFRLGYLLDLVGQYASDVDYEALRENYLSLPKNSFDYEVVEKARSVAVIPYSGSWRDLGTWNSLSGELADSVSGPVWLDDDSTTDLTAINETELPLVVAGVSNAVVVATSDGILVSGREASERVKGLVADAAFDQPRYERRRWGEYRVLSREECGHGLWATTSSLRVDALAQLPYVCDAACTVVWTVTRGNGQVVVDGKVREVRAGDVVRVPAGSPYAMRAVEEMKVVEVRLGAASANQDGTSCEYFWR